MNKNEAVNRIRDVLIELYWGHMNHLSQDDRNMWAEQLRVDITDDEIRRDWQNLPKLSSVLETIKEALDDDD